MLSNMTNDEVMQYVINSIRIIRKKKKISQIELCLRANMSQGFLTNIETGKKEPSVMTLIRIANALEVSPRDFFPENINSINDDIKQGIKEDIINLLNHL